MQRNRAFIFPGQGSQSPQMAQELYKNSSIARAYLEQAEKIVPGLLSACVGDASELLAQTEMAQPAIFTVSALLWQELPVDFRQGYLAGHSLGEYTALFAAGVLDFNTALQVVKIRAELMGKTAQKVGGGMLAVIGLDGQEMRSVIAQLQLDTIVFLANQNSPQQMVLSGTNAGLQLMEEYLGTKDGVRSVRLAVSGPFHSPLMAPVAQEFAAVINALPLAEPQLPLVSPTTGGLLTTATEVRQALLQQFSSPVLWTNTVVWLSKHGVQNLVEVGPGKVLTGLVRRIDPSLRRFNVQGLKDVNSVPIQVAEKGEG